MFATDWMDTTRAEQVLSFQRYAGRPATRLRAIERNKAIRVKPRRAHGAWLFARLAPGLLQRLPICFLAQQRASQLARTASTVVGPG